ncbi:unnamed protein product, partial [Prorocentrum cordatum]
MLVIEEDHAANAGADQAVDLEVKFAAIPAESGVAEVQRLQEQPGCGIAGAKCVASIPVLGKRTYQESLRVALCRDGAVSTLAIQVAGTLKIGFPVGDFLTETLHLFTQAGDAAPVCLQSWGMAQPGAQQRKALDGMRGKQLEYPG